MPGPPAAYFDSNGQPTAANKISTVGTASATGSVGARTTTEAGDGDSTEVDEDVMSMDTNYRAMDVDSTSGVADPMDEDLTSRSVGGFEDRMSDDGTASLVGFGEGGKEFSDPPTALCNEPADVVRTRACPSAIFRGRVPNRILNGASYLG